MDDSATCANCGRDLTTAEDGYTHVPETFSLPCAGPRPATADDLVGFLRARLVEQLRNGNFLGGDFNPTPARLATGVGLIRDANAKRQILDECNWGGPDHADIYDAVVRRLALPYADHPDYLPEWKP